MDWNDIDPLGRKILTEERLHRFLQVAAQRLACLTIVFERMHDPLNISASLRSSEAFGVHRAWYVSDRELPINGTISGSAKRWIDVRHHRSLPKLARQLKDDGFTLLGTLPAPTAVPVHELPLPPKTAIIMGNEHTGLSDEAQDLCDHLITIPMYGFAESLNLSTATAILVRHFAEAYRASHYPISLPEAKQKALIDAWVARDVNRKTRGLVNPTDA